MEARRAEKSKGYFLAFFIFMKPNKFKEYIVELKAGQIPPRVATCPCGAKVEYPDYECKICLRQLVFYVKSYEKS